MSEQSSRTSLTPVAFFHADDCSLRMSQATLLWEAPPLLERLPDWGMTGDGALYPRPKPGHHTCDADGFASPDLPMPLLPTPQHWDHKVFGPNVDWKKRKEKHADSVASVLITQPWLDGNESSDGQHLTQLTTEDYDPDSSNG